METIQNARMISGDYRGAIPHAEAIAIQREAGFRGVEVAADTVDVVRDAERATRRAGELLTMILRSSGGGIGADLDTLDAVAVRLPRDMYRPARKVESVNIGHAYRKALDALADLDLIARALIDDECERAQHYAAAEPTGQRNISHMAYPHGVLTTRSAGRY